MSKHPTSHLKDSLSLSLSPRERVGAQKNNSQPAQKKTRRIRSSSTPPKKTRRHGQTKKERERKREREREQNRGCKCLTLKKGFLFRISPHSVSSSSSPLALFHVICPRFHSTPVCRLQLLTFSRQTTPRCPLSTSSVSFLLLPASLPLVSLFKPIFSPSSSVPASSLHVTP